MKQLLTKVKPKHGFAYVLHLGLLTFLPALIFIMVRINFVPMALALILLSKWRMLAVRPRHWPANIRANAIDITVGFSFVIFMTQTDSQMWQLLWAASYGVWLIFIKPLSNVFWVSLQAMIGQLLGMVAVFQAFGASPVAVLVLSTWVVCYTAARHFFTSFEEPYTPLLSYVWAYFASALVWVLSHWLLFYGGLSQPTLLLTVIGYGLASLYYLYETDRLSAMVRRQIVFIMVAIIIVVIAFSDWGDKTV